MSYIIVIGNEKGGTGKSTICMHIIVSLLRAGHSVGSVDIDARQGTLSRYVQNRRRQENLPLPQHFEIFKSECETTQEAYIEDERNFKDVMQQLSDKDFIVIDTPGHDIFLSRLAHSFAHILITPINDSFVDLDLLVSLNETGEILKPSIYAETVWNQKKERALRDGGTIEWMVLRNRMSTIYSHNKNDIEKVLKALSKRIGFQLAPGFTERVIFKELFLKGITLDDLEETKVQLSLSHIAARQELSQLMKLIMDNIEKMHQAHKKVA